MQIIIEAEADTFRLGWKIKSVELSAAGCYLMNDQVLNYSN